MSLAEPEFTQLLDALGVSDDRVKTLLLAANSSSGKGGRSGRDPAAAARALQASNRALHDQLELLACALGACPQCWGADPDCTECGGVGSPGAYLPDEECFRHFVLPVIQRVTHSLSDSDANERRLISDRHPNLKPVSGKGENP